MTTPTFNKFKSTTIYGAFNNADYEDNSMQASANIQRNLTVGGNIYGAKLFYNGSDISSSFASTLMPNFLSSINIGVTDPLVTSYDSTISNASGTVTMNTYNGVYPIRINASNFQLSKNNGTNYYDILTTNTGALLSGATFTGNVSGLTATTTDNSTKFATTAFVKGQNYLTSASLSSYALLSSATFTGNVSGLTAITTDNSTKFATTAFVKGQNYLTSASLSSYALLSGATFTGTVNCNNGLTTAAAKDVHISCNNTFPNTISGGKQGLGFFWNQSGGRGEVNLLCYGQGGAGGLSIWSSSMTNAPSKIVEFYPDFCSFENEVTMNQSLNVKNTLNITQPSSTSSAMLQFVDDTGSSRANIYSSVSDSVFRFSVQSGLNTNGFEWAKGGTTLMQLDLNGNLTTTGSISTSSTTIATQGILSGGTQNLTFPLSSSYLIQTQVTALVNLPTITSESQMGVEVLFIKNSGSCTIYSGSGSGNVIIQTGLSQSTNINLSQYMRLISTRLTSGGGVYGWMVIGSG